MEERLCAYSRAVSHFPTAVKEVISGTQFFLGFVECLFLVMI